MSIDIKRIAELVDEVSAETAARSARIQEEQRRKMADLETRHRQQRIDEVAKTISSLQETIERRTRERLRFADLLSISSSELLFEPREYFFSHSVKVPMSRTPFSRGFKPDCLPDYAKRLFDYCEENGLITTFGHDEDHYGGFNSHNIPQWKQWTYKITIYW